MKHVLLITGKDLITNGIASLLKKVKDIDLLIKSFDNMSQLIKEINIFHPQVVILNDSLEFAMPSCVFWLLSKFPDLRILVIDDKKNLIHVYEKQEVIVTNGGALIESIR
jgi:hypothetical protein